MGEGKSDTENLEDLIKKQKEGEPVLQAPWFEKEDEPIILLDENNRIVFVNKKVKDIIGAERFEELQGQDIYGFLDERDVENYKELVAEAHIAGYNHLHFQFRKIDFTAELKRDKNGKYLGAVAKLRKETLAELAKGLVHRTRISMGKTICDSEGTPVCEMDIVEAFYAKELLGISLNFLVKTVTEDNARQVLDEAVRYLSHTALKGSSIDIMINAKRLSKPSLRLLAYMQYDSAKNQVLSKAFEREISLKLSARSKYKNRFWNYVSDFKALPVELDDAKLGYLEAAVEKQAAELHEWKICAKDSQETYYSKVTEAFKNIFREMLKKANLYQMHLPEGIKPDRPDPLAKNAEEFLGRIDLKAGYGIEDKSPEGLNQGSYLTKFRRLVDQFSSLPENSRRKLIRYTFEPVFERYIYVQSFYLFRKHKHKPEQKEEPKPEQKQLP